MKLSQIKKDDIHRAILDIYEQPEKALNVEERAIVVDNYMAWIPQYENIISQLPDGMVQKDTSISIEIMDTKDPSYRLAKWYGDLAEKSPVLKADTRYYADTLPTPIMEVMHDRINALLIKTEKLSKEKRNLRNFVEECLNKVTTTKQLRELWTDYPALSKHIPPEPVRAKKSQQATLELESTLDMGAVNKRLTENLLGG